MDAIETYSLIAKDLARVPYDGSEISIMRELTRCGWIRICIPSTATVSFAKSVNGVPCRLVYNGTRLVLVQLSENSEGFFDWVLGIYARIIRGEYITCEYAPQEVLCDQLGAAVFNSKLSERLPRIQRAQIESRFADLARHTDFTNLEQIRKVLYAASI